MEVQTIRRSSCILNYFCNLFTTKEDIEKKENKLQPDVRLKAEKGRTRTMIAIGGKTKSLQKKNQVQFHKVTFTTRWWRASISRARNSGSFPFVRLSPNETVIRFRSLDRSKQNVARAREVAQRKKKMALFNATNKPTLLHCAILSFCVP